MVDITKTAYSSEFYYPEILYNQAHVIASGETLVIPYDFGFVPFARVWGELYSGEFSSVWFSSTQYLFNMDYENQGIFGYLIKFNVNSMTIQSFNPTNKTVYVRMYKNE